MSDKLIQTINSCLILQATAHLWTSFIQQIKGNNATQLIRLNKIGFGLSWLENSHQNIQQSHCNQKDKGKFSSMIRIIIINKHVVMKILVLIGIGKNCWKVESLFWNLHLHSLPLLSVVSELRSQRALTSQRLWNCVDKCVLFGSVIPQPLSETHVLKGSRDPEGIYPIDAFFTSWGTSVGATEGGGVVKDTDT